MSSDQDERLANELSLLEAMYLDQIIFDQHIRELKYTKRDRIIHPENPRWLPHRSLA